VTRHHPLRGGRVPEEGAVTNHGNAVRPRQRLNLGAPLLLLLACLDLKSPGCLLLTNSTLKTSSRPSHIQRTPDKKLSTFGKASDPENLLSLTSTNLNQQLPMPLQGTIPKIDLISLLLVAAYVPRLQKIRPTADYPVHPQSDGLHVIHNFTTPSSRIFLATEQLVTENLTFRNL
jgi:hypothetical protein